MSRFVVFALIVGVAGCSSNKPVKQPVVKKAPKKATKKDPGQLVSASPNIGISNDLLDQCMVRMTDVGKVPKFDYDEFDLLKEDRQVLDAIGRCVMPEGPLAGRAIQLVGRADPRGTQEYNLALGNKRASAVSDYLARMGVAREQLATTTRGDLDANGGDEVSWRNDRRVDVQLMEDIKTVSSR
jgi:outer membrane protein OmpA-like peptidoglycan-associated protein